MPKRILGSTNLVPSVRRTEKGLRDKGVVWPHALASEEGQAQGVVKDGPNLLKAWVAIPLLPIREDSRQERQGELQTKALGALLSQFSPRREFCAPVSQTWRAVNVCVPSWK